MCVCCNLTSYTSAKSVRTKVVISCVVFCVVMVLGLYKDGALILSPMIELVGIQSLHRIGKSG